jgi:hypothetical protein
MSGGTSDYIKWELLRARHSRAAFPYGLATLAIANGGFA